MGWWDLAGDDVMGDEAADALGNALEALEPKPTVRQMADALASALGQAADDLAPHGPLERLAVEAPGGAVAESDGAAPNEFTARIRESIVRVAATYQRRWNRKPTLNETLECFRFVLGAAAIRYLADAPRLDRIDAVTSEAGEGRADGS